jgi:hypothetical protein
MYATIAGVLLLALAWHARGWTSSHGMPPESFPAQG